jgi:HPt (histidine-containing phosphotransfer) domain-containing protein
MTLDRAALDNLLDITGGDPEFLDELIDTFLSDAEAQLAAMRQAIADGDETALLRPAHSLKSNSTNVGATALAELCREIEADARAGGVPDAEARVSRVAAELAGVRAALLEARARA